MFHVCALEGGEHPDINEVMEAVPGDLYSRYKFVSVRRISPLKEEAISRSLNDLPVTSGGKAA